MGNERKLSVAESWRLALVDPTHRGEGAVGTVFAEIQSLAGRPVETRTCDRPEPADLALVDVTVVDLTAEMVTPVDLLLDTVTARPHVPVLAVVQKNDPDLASRAEVAGAQVVIRMGEDAEEFREALLTAVRDLLTLGRPVIGGRRGTTGALAQSNPEVFGSLVYRYAREVQARVDLRRGAVTEGHPAPKRSGLSALSAALVELEAGPRDLTDVHMMALRSLCRDTSASAQRQLVHDARLVLVETMGRLAGRYRHQALFTRQSGEGADDGVLA